MIELSGADTPVAVAAAPRDHLLRRLWRHRSGRFGLALLVFFVILAVFGPLLVTGRSSANLHYQDLDATLQSPSLQHVLGTDPLGRDELVRLILGARYTILIGVGAVALGMLVGVILGALSGFYGRGVDLGIQRIIDILLAFPNFLMALALIAVMGPGLRNLIVAVSLASLPRFVRLTRASVLTVRERLFVEAVSPGGRSCGATCCPTRSRRHSCRRRWRWGARC
jgi:peptide/nickel transport system permease protein